MGPASQKYAANHFLSTQSKPLGKPFTALTFSRPKVLSRFSNRFRFLQITPVECPVVDRVLSRVLFRVVSRTSPCAHRTTHSSGSVCTEASGSSSQFPPDLLPALRCGLRSNSQKDIQPIKSVLVPFFTQPGRCENNMPSNLQFQSCISG